MRNLPLRDWWPLLVAKLGGHFQYYGVSGNFPALSRYYDRALHLLVRALARWGQKPTQDRATLESDLSATRVVADRKAKNSKGV